MKGWYVIWNEDTEDYSTKREALKRGKEIYKKGLDDEVMLQHYDDENPDGYLAGEQTIFIKNII